MSLDSKVLEQSGSKRSLLPKENSMLFTRLQSVMPSPKVASIISSTRNIRLRKQIEAISSNSKTMSESRHSLDMKNFKLENYTLKEKSKELTDNSDANCLRGKVKDYEDTINQLQRDLKLVVAENARLKAEKLHIEATCKEVCYLLTTNAVATNQKAIGKLRKAIKDLAPTFPHSSRSTPYLLLDEEPQLDDGIRLKSKTTSNKVIGKRSIRSPYNASPGAVRSLSKIRRLRSPSHPCLTGTLKPKSRSCSESRSPSPLDSLDTARKLQFIRDKTMSILQAWRYSSML